MVISSAPDNVTFAFIKLQRLGAGFEELRGGVPTTRGHERTMRRLTGELGVTALPLLLRKLSGNDEGAAAWARQLLGGLAERDAASRDRVVAALEALRAGAESEPARERAMALLEDLGAAPEPAEPADDPQLLRDHSLRELARCLDTAAEVARAADLLVVQLDDAELLSFLDDFATGEPRRAAALIDELVVRDDLEERTRSELRRLRAPLREAHRSRRPTARPTVRVGDHDDGRCVIVAAVRRSGNRPLRYRALWAVIDAAGGLVDAGYCSELTGGAIQRDLIEPMREEGFAVERAPVRAGRARLIGAARATIAAGGRLPADYYLGRDILGLRDEHWVQDRAPDDDLAALLARAIDLLSIGEHERARPLLERYVGERPDDAEGVANLGMCLMTAGDTAAACELLQRATCLDPEDALHHWNLAAAAHRAGERGRCYRALRDYLAHRDPRADAERRLQAALSFITEHERLAALAGRDPGA